MTAAFSQPIEMRLNELIAGVRGDVAIKIYGDDLEELRRLAGEAQGILVGIRGASEVSAEQLTGQPVLQVKIDPDAIARFGVPRRNVLSVVETVGTKKIGEVREGQRRFPLVVRLPDRQRSDPEILAATLIPTAAGPVLPLDRVARIVETSGPATINREWGKRRAVVQSNVRGRDVAGFIAEAREKIGARLALPEGYTMEWGGQFENMERARRHLMIIVPITIGAIFFLLFLLFRSLRFAALIILVLPFASIGGVASLYFSGEYLSVPASVGFIALWGIAVLNGVVLVSCIRGLREAGTPRRQAIFEGALARFRPVMMTATVAALGLVPFLFAKGPGSEVQRPLAIVVIGGLVTSTLLTLVVVPALYGLFDDQPPERAATVS